jgi:aminodeoxyfutalosine deaminase
VSGLEAFVHAMPKVELHVHLEGSMRPATLLALARKNGVELPAADVEGLRRWFRFKDFEHFVEIYLACSSALVEPEDFERLALDYLEKQAEQNVVYCETHFTISTHVAEGRDGSGILDALLAAQAEGRRRWGVELQLIPDIVRNVPIDRADVTLEWALEGRRRGLVAALGLSGLEATHPNEPFVPHFTAAEREGLHRVAHAGEHAGPQAIRNALELASAERIGHGVRAVEDPSLVAELAARRIPLEVCPTSNLCLSVFGRMEDHSFDHLYRAGVPVSVNSDDPPFFNTTLSGEYLALADAFGYDAETLAGLALAGVHHAFLSAEETAEREAEFRRRFAELGREHLGRPVEPAPGPGAEPGATGD